MRKLILSLGILGLCACSGQNSKVSISKTLRGNNAEIFENDDIRAAVNGSCLRLDLLLKGISEVNGLANVYVSDLDLGSLAGPIDKPGFFTPINDGNDPSGRAAYFLKGDAISQNSVLPATLKSTAATSLIDVQGMTDDCKTVSFNQGGKRKIFDVKVSGRRFLIMQSQDAGGEIRRYSLRGETLDITVFRIAHDVPACVKSGAGPLIEKRTLKIAWNQDADAIQIERRFAILLSDSLNVPADFSNYVTGKAAISPTRSIPYVAKAGKRARVGAGSQRSTQALVYMGREMDINFNTYNYLSQAVQHGQFKRAPVCGDAISK